MNDAQVWCNLESLFFSVVKLSSGINGEKKLWCFCYVTQLVPFMFHLFTIKWVVTLENDQHLFICDMHMIVRLKRL